MQIIDYYKTIRDEKLDELSEKGTVDVDEWVILQNLPSRDPNPDWVDRAIVYVESIHWARNPPDEDPEIIIEGYEFVNLLEHMEYGTPIDGGEELLKRFSRALERGDLHYELSRGQLGIDLHNIVVANKIDVDWMSFSPEGYTWKNPTWRIKRLNDPQMLQFMGSINYRLIL